MTTSLARAAAVFAAFLAPALTFAETTVVGGVSSNGGGFLGFSWGGGGGAGCFSAICSVANTILYLINFVAVPVLFAVAFIVFLYGIAQAYIFSRGDPEKVKVGHSLILWGIIGFAVMISLWGLVNVVAATFGLAGYSAPPLPRSY
ncbi:hypothetical protein HY091_02125 [Candidatus Kaiserbacteria bacterium]|nr:hypothetical protein [Candidatus Kaiserbacteria bacterium]